VARRTLGGPKGGNAKASKRRNEYTDTFKDTQITCPPGPARAVAHSGGQRSADTCARVTRARAPVPSGARSRSERHRDAPARTGSRNGGRAVLPATCPEPGERRAGDEWWRWDGGGTVAQRSPELPAARMGRAPILRARGTRAHPDGQLWRAAESRLARRRFGGWPGWASDLITRGVARDALLSESEKSCISSGRRVRGNGGCGTASRCRPSALADSAAHDAVIGHPVHRRATASSSTNV
jgi:hypothetical protein